MTREEAEIYAKTMTYEDALHNLFRARAIPYRKATFIKVSELIKALSQESTKRDVVGYEGIYTVTQKSGRWKVHKKYYECSNCESQISNEFFVNYRFCPHCGAKLESEDKTE